MHDCLVTELRIDGNFISNPGSLDGQILAVCLEKRSYAVS